MSPAEYKAARKERGTQQGVAALLGVRLSTIQRRESGKIKITREAEIALLALRKQKRAPRRLNDQGQLTPSK